MRICQGCFNDLPLSGNAGTNLALTAMPHTLAACQYAFPINELIIAYKYEGKLALLPLLAELILTLPRPHPKTLLVPMPSSSARLKSRGYDHIHLLTKRLAKTWKLPLWQGVKRQGDAPQQKGLSRDQRLKNIQGQFKLIHQPPTGHRLLIIDDVCTTGSTITALTECLAQTRLHVSAYVLAHKHAS